jgi:hypothetical protein
MVEFWSDGVLEYCRKIVGFLTIAPALQYSNTPVLI